MNPSPAACQIKRFLEVWTSGIYSHEAILAAPDEIFKEHRIDLDPSLLPSLANSSLMIGKDGKSQFSLPWFADFLEHIRAKLQWREKINRECAPANPSFRAWRERQMRRCRLELGEEQNAQIVHTPLAFELAKGCSVQCWFCALDSPPLTKLFEYSPGNARLWNDVLAVVRAVIGPAAKWGSSYWATEPLDNPDYEKLCEDFCAALGMFPQTTTAIPLRNCDRVKRLLRRSFECGCLVNRFSVQSGTQLKQIHRQFTPEELAWTELILQNKESDSIKARAGRAWRLKENQPELAEREERKLLCLTRERNPELAKRATRFCINAPGEGAPVVVEGSAALDPSQPECNVTLNISGTTSCASGFVINMAERTVELISPCTASETWPLGQIVFDRGKFETAADLEALLSGMIERNMSESILAETRVRFTDRVKYAQDKNGFHLNTAFAGANCLSETSGPYLRRLGELLHQGDNSAGEIAVQCFFQFGMPEGLTVGTINNLFANGMVEEAAQPSEVNA